MKPLIQAFIFGACVLTSTALATPTPLYTDTLTFHGYPYGLGDGSVMVGKASLSGVVTPAFEAWCIVRGAPQVAAGSTYNVNVFRLNDLDLVDLLGVSVTQLNVMALLGSGFNNTNPNDKMRQHGIWEQTRPNLINLTAQEQVMVDNAFANVGSFNGSNYLVALPTAWGTTRSVGQPIMWQDTTPGDTPEVPEPSTMALMGAGLISLCVFRRK